MSQLVNYTSYSRLAHLIFFWYLIEEAGDGRDCVRKGAATGKTEVTLCGTKKPSLTFFVSDGDNTGQGGIIVLSGPEISGGKEE